MTESIAIKIDPGLLAHSKATSCCFGLLSSKRLEPGLKILYNLRPDSRNKEVMKRVTGIAPATWLFIVFLTLIYCIAKCSIVDLGGKEGQ